MRYFTQIFDEIRALKPFWQGAIYGCLVIIVTAAAILGFHFQTGLVSIIMSFIWVIIGVTLFWILLTLLNLTHRGISAVPRIFLIILLSSGLSLYVIRDLRSYISKILVSENKFDYTFFPLHLIGGFYLIINAVLFGHIWTLFRSQTAKKDLRQGTIWVIIIMILNIYGFYWLADEGKTPNQTLSIQQNEPSNLKDPSTPGSLGVDQFTYGSGTDKRTEFGENIAYQTPTVDGSLLLPQWKNSKGYWRENFWGFNSTELPLNGRVWIPESEGSFPLVLMVHGNHTMEDYSDEGYGYLGELLASRGSIAVSVDENFINGTWSGDFRGKEMPIRAWLLLKHIEQWQTWNEDPDHDLFGKINMDKIILIGHSRGGEAVPIAAKFNRLPHFPDNGEVKFDFNFNIIGLIAIAPTDKRYNRRIELENINYLTLQGSYDSDESSFFGLRQAQRINFTDSSYWFKTGIYLHGANHGQFNTTWGRTDIGVPWSWLLNLEPVMTASDQQQFAKVFITAFTEVVFNERKEYLALFQEPVSASWLPEKLIIKDFKDSSYEQLISWEEDLDITIWPKGNISQRNLKTWHERELEFRDSDTQGVNGVVIGRDTANVAPLPYYRLRLDSAQSISKYNKVVFNLATLSSKQAPLSSLKIRIYDSKDQYQDQKIEGITPPLKVQFLKLAGLNEERYGDLEEAVLEDYRIELSGARAKGLQDIKQMDIILVEKTANNVFINEIGFEE